MRIHRVTKERVDKAEYGYSSSDESEEEEEEDEEDEQKESGPEGRWGRISTAVIRHITRMISDTTDMEGTDFEKKQLLSSSTGATTTSRSHMMLPKAFITFKTYAAASEAKQVMHASVPGAMVVTEAPEPIEIHWSNFTVTRTSRTYRIVAGETLTILLLAAYIVPVTLVAILVSPDSLSARWVSESSSRTGALFACHSLMNSHGWCMYAGIAGMGGSSRHISQASFSVR